jgi:hypothetical protein
MKNQFLTSTYTWIFNFGHKIVSKLAIRLIRGSTYTRVYTVLQFTKNYMFISLTYNLMRKKFSKITKNYILI